MRKLSAETIRRLMQEHNVSVERLATHMGMTVEQVRTGCEEGVAGSASKDWRRSIGEARWMPDVGKWRP